MKNQEARGKAKKALGQGKEIVGILTGDSALELEGDRQRALGAAQESLGKARRKVSELGSEVTNAIKK